MSTRLVCLVAAALAAGSVGCAALWGFEPLGGSDADGGGAAGGGAGGGGGGGGGTNNGSGSDAGDEGPDLPYAGTLAFSFSSGAEVADGGSFLVYGAFEASDAALSPNQLALTGCVSPVVGGCCLGSTGGAPLTPAATVSAGSITVIDPPSNGVPVDARLFDAGVYYETSAFHWVPGDSLSATATGDVVSVFAGFVVAPDPVANLNPPFDQSSVAQPVPVSTSVPLVVSWTAGPPGGVIFLGMSNLGCVADDSAGTLQVAADLLGTLPKGETAYVNFDRIRNQKVVAANADIVLSASTNRVGIVLYQQ